MAPYGQIGVRIARVVEPPITESCDQGRGFSGAFQVEFAVCRDDLIEHLQPVCDRVRPLVIGCGCEHQLASASTLRMQIDEEVLGDRQQGRVHFGPTRNFPFHFRLAAKQPPRQRKQIAGITLDEGESAFDQHVCPQQTTVEVNDQWRFAFQRLRLCATARLYRLAQCGRSQCAGGHRGGARQSTLTAVAFI